MTFAEAFLLTSMAVSVCLPGLMASGRTALALLPDRIAADGVWVHTGTTIGLFGNVVACANPAAGATVTIALFAVAAGFAVRG